ncbi:MAG: transglutaminase domain-containing protein [candidate division WOR-3 bacterium]|nr:MAG: transglutaminase domain-containing protein [candidate division WOR-3 bacterium]
MSKKQSEDNLNDILNYYTAHSIMTDPGNYAHLYEDLPADISELCKVVQGVMIHVFWTQGYGVELSEERKKEVQMRTVEDMLARIIELDERAINSTREPDLRVVGNCRDFSLLLCSFLRHRDIPARARCGFGTYFTPGKYEDHWICEYWNSQEKRWVMVDAQLDSLQLTVLKIDFNTHDLPQGKFLTAGETWQLCRSGKIDPDLCGIFDMKGLWFVAGDVMRDFMALNKLEILPWDCNELMKAHGEQLSHEDYVLLDKLAGLTTAGSNAFLEIRALYDSTPALRMPTDWRP